MRAYSKPAKRFFMPLSCEYATCDRFIRPRRPGTPSPMPEGRPKRPPTNHREVEYNAHKFGEHGVDVVSASFDCRTGEIQSAIDALGTLLPQVVCQSA